MRRNAVFTRRTISTCFTGITFVPLITFLALLSLHASACVDIPWAGERCRIVVSQIGGDIKLVLRSFRCKRLGLDKVNRTLVCLQCKRNTDSAYGALIVLHLCDLYYAALQCALSHYTCIGVSYEPVLCGLIDMRRYTIRASRALLALRSGNTVGSCGTCISCVSLRTLLALSSGLASGQTECERENFGRVLS